MKTGSCNLVLVYQLLTTVHVQLHFNGGTEKLFISKILQYIHVHTFPQQKEIIFSTTISIFAAANYFYSPVAAAAVKNWITLPTIQAFGHNWLLFSFTTANHVCWWTHTSHWLANKAVMLHKLKRIHPQPKNLQPWYSIYDDTAASVANCCTES